MISYHYLCVFLRHSCILFTFVPIPSCVQWLHRFLRKWASRAFPASSRRPGARTLRCSCRVQENSWEIEVDRKWEAESIRAGFLCLFEPRPGHCQFVFSHSTCSGWTTCAGRIQGQQWWPVGGAHLASRGLWCLCLVLHIPSDSRCPVRNSSQVISHMFNLQVLPCLMFAFILKVVVLPLVTPGRCVGAGHHIGQPCCSGCPRAAVDQQRRPPCVEGMGWLTFWSTDVIFLIECHSAMVKQRFECDMVKAGFCIFHKELGFSGVDSIFVFCYNGVIEQVVKKSQSISFCGNDIEFWRIKSNPSWTSQIH